MVFGFAADSQSSRLHIREYDAYQLAEGSGIERWDSFVATSLGITGEDSVSADGVGASLTGLL